MTGIVTAFPTIKSNQIILTALAVFSPFLHLFAPNGQEGVFGWKFMSSFLDAIGWALFAFFLGLSLLFEATSRIDSFKSVYIIRAMIVIWVGVFYIAYAIIPIKDFTNFQYYTSLTLIAVGVSMFSYGFVKAKKWVDHKLREVIRNLYHRLLVELPNEGFIKETKLNEYHNDNQKLINNTADEF